MSTDRKTNRSDQAAVVEFAYDVAQFWDRHLGQRLCGVYLIGSLAHGGFSAQYSDIDIALIAAGPLESNEIDLVYDKVVARWATLSSKLSLFWADQFFSAGRFPPLDRIDYIDHAVTLLERRHVCPTRPVLPEIRAYLRSDPFRNWSQEVQVLSALSELIVADYKRYLRALLYPARFFYIWETGAIGSNAEAVAFLQGRALQIDIDLIVRALHCRNQGGDLKSLLESDRNCYRFVICVDNLSPRRMNWLHEFCRCELARFTDKPEELANSYKPESLRE
jgi:hypothetical protein